MSEPLTEMMEIYGRVFCVPHPRHAIHPAHISHSSAADGAPALRKTASTTRDYINSRGLPRSMWSWWGLKSNPHPLLVWANLLESCFVLLRYPSVTSTVLLVCFTSSCITKICYRPKFLGKHGSKNLTIK